MIDRLITNNNTTILDKDKLSLCETLDRLLAKGVVVSGEIMISVADVDLLYLDLQLLLTSVKPVIKPNHDAE